MSTLLFNPQLTTENLLKEMADKGIVHDTFTNYVVNSENKNELTSKILAFTASATDLLCQIASCTHGLDETDHASALEFIQDLTKKCEEFGAPEMLKHCDVLKHKCIAHDDVQSRESLELLNLKYDILQRSLLGLVELQNTPLHFNQVHNHAMERYQRVLDVITNRWLKDARDAGEAQKMADEAGPSLGTSGGCGYGGEV